MSEVEVNSAYRRTIKETLLLLFSGTLAVSITLLVYLRLLDSQWIRASADMGFVSIMLLLFLLVYAGRKTRTAGILMALGFISAALTSTLVLGPSEIFWAFPALMVAYFMLDARQATILTGGFVACFLVIVWDDLPAIALIKICLTLVITVLLANAFSLTNRRQLDDLRREINVDPLTGAGNRRALNLKLDSVAAIFRRNNSPASLLIFDIDHFKRINDTYGHIVGDRILIQLNELVRRNTRATESLYRYGGEEFVLVAEQTRLDEAVELAEKVRNLIEQEMFTAGTRVTVSIGVAQLQHRENTEEWLNRADAALYRAKERGRNQVTAAAAQASSLMLSTPTSLLPEEFTVRGQAAASSGIRTTSAAIQPAELLTG